MNAPATKTRATCPGGATGPCGKVVLETVAGTFANHRRPTGGNCSVGILDRVRAKDRVHGCADCAALPAHYDGQPPATVSDALADRWRPLRPRAVAGRGGVPVRNLCHSHLKAVRDAQRAAKRVFMREYGRGLTEDDRALLWAAQGQACACCGRGLKTAKAPALDHCHTRAATHDHPVEKACRRCARGLLCSTCNRQTVGDANREPSSLVGQYIAGDNPAARLGWWEEGATVPEKEPAQERADQRDRYRELESIKRTWTTEEATEAHHLRRAGAHR